MPQECREEMRAVLESAAREYHQNDGNVSDDFFAVGADALAKLCHPEFFTIDGFDWTAKEVAALVAELNDARQGCRYSPLMQKAVLVLSAMGEHVFCNTLTPPETKILDT